MAAYFEAGKYRIRIVSQALGENNHANPEVQIVFDIIGHYGQTGLTRMAGEYPRTVFLVLTEKTIGTEAEPGWVLEVLRSLGFNGQSFAQLDPGSKDHISFVGKEVDARCNHETWDNKEREKWSIVRPSNGKPINIAKPIEKKGLRALDAKFGKTLKALAAKPVPVTAGGGGDDDPLDPPPPGREEESIPF